MDPGAIPEDRTSLAAAEAQDSALRMARDTARIRMAISRSARSTFLATKTNIPEATKATGRTGRSARFRHLRMEMLVVAPVAPADRTERAAQATVVCSDRRKRAETAITISGPDQVKAIHVLAAMVTCSDRCSLAMEMASARFTHLLPDSARIRMAVAADPVARRSAPASPGVDNLGPEPEMPAARTVAVMSTAAAITASAEATETPAEITALAVEMATQVATEMPVATRAEMETATTLAATEITAWATVSIRSRQVIRRSTMARARLLETPATTTPAAMGMATDV